VPVANIGSFGYNVLLLLHIATVIVGFGGLALGGVYNRKAMKSGSAAANISTVNFEVNKLCEYAVYLVPILGIGLLGASGGAYKFSQGWVSASFALYIVGIGIAHGLMIPSHRKLNAALASGGPSSPEVPALNQRLTVGGAVLNLLLVVIIVLMIWKPGV
jgi:uncharacterized membrane protein